MYPMLDLSPRRTAVLSFIRDRVVGHGQPPTLAEIAEACGLATRGAARKHVLKRWLFRPAMQGGRAVQAVGLVPVQFTMR